MAIMANVYTGSNVGKAGLEIKKTTGSPDVRGVTEINLDSNLSLSDNGNGSVSIDSSGGGGGSAVPGGSNTQVQFNDSNAFGGNANLVFDKTSGRLGVGISAPLGNLHLKSAEVENNLLIETSTDPVTGGAPDMILYQNAAIQNDDGIGAVYFAGQNSSGAGSQINYAEFYATARDVTAGNEDGSLIFKVRTDGTENNRIGIMPTETVFNEDAQGGTATDIDFRFETNQTQHMLFVKASTNTVGIKQSNPVKELDVAGTIRQTNTTDAIVYANASGDLGSLTLGSGLTLTGSTLDLTTQVRSAGNPTQTIGAVAVNGTANTFMRSDAAPALQPIAGLTPATYGDPTKVAQVEVDATGRVIAIGEVVITGPTPQPAGAAKDIQFNGAGAFDGNSNFTFDSSTSKMAIGNGAGTASSTITIYQTTGGDSQGINIKNASNKDWYIYQDTNEDLIIRDDGSTKVTFDRTNSRIGINVASPAQALDVDGSIQQSAFTDNIAYVNEVGKMKQLLYDSSIVLDVAAGADNFGTIRANLLGNKQTASTTNGPLPRRDVFGTLVPFGWIAIPSSVTQLGANAPSTNGGNVYVPCWYSP